MRKVILSAAVFVFSQTRIGSNAGIPAEDEQSAAVSGTAIAILPLANISRDPADQFLADGLTEELVNVLVSSGSTMVGAWAAFRLQDLPPASDETVGGPVIDVRDRPAELQTAADRRQPETTEQRSSVSLVAVVYGGRSELAPGN